MGRDIFLKSPSSDKPTPGILRSFCHTHRVNIPGIVLIWKREEGEKEALPSPSFNPLFFAYLPLFLPDFHTCAFHHEVNLLCHNAGMITGSFQVA